MTLNQAPVPLSPEDDQAKTHALIAYGLMLAGLFTLLFWLVGGIWAMVKKSDAANSKFADHYANLTSVFWWGLFWAILGVLLSVIVVGYFILGVLFLWALYRLIKGLARITSNQTFEV